MTRAWPVRCAAEPGPNSVPRPNWALLHACSPSAADGETVIPAGSVILTFLSSGVALTLRFVGLRDLQIDRHARRLIRLGGAAF